MLVTAHRKIITTLMLTLDQCSIIDLIYSQITRENLPKIAKKFMFSFRLAIGCRNMSGQAKISSFFTQSTNKRVISNGDTVVISLFISKTNAKSITVYNAMPI